jgi:hypothetical protein
MDDPKKETNTENNSEAKTDDASSAASKISLKDILQDLKNNNEIGSKVIHVAEGVDFSKLDE